MTPEQVPEELVLIAAKAGSPHFASLHWLDDWEKCFECRTAYSDARNALAAALPAHEAMVREQVAEDLESRDPAEWALAGQHAGRDAARIARGSLTITNPPSGEMS